MKNYWTTFLRCDTGHKENDAPSNYSIVACVFVAAVTYFTEPLPSNDRGIHVQTNRLMGDIYVVRR
jgi:hypothetical protein